MELLELPKNQPKEIDLQNAPTIKNWVESINKTDIFISSLKIASVDVFPGSRIGFIEMEAKYKSMHKENSLSPQKMGRFLISSGSVAIVPLIKCKETKKIYTILVRQPRIGCGQMMFEYPAGMVEEGSDYRSAALREFNEECSITAKDSDLINVGELLYKDDINKDKNYSLFLTNPYITADATALFVVKKSMTVEEIGEIEGRCGGADPDEQITQHIIPFDDVFMKSNDVSTLAMTSVVRKLIKNRTISLDF